MKKLFLLLQANPDIRVTFYQGVGEDGTRIRVEDGKSFAEVIAPKEVIESAPVEMILTNLEDLIKKVKKESASLIIKAKTIIP